MYFVSCLIQNNTDKRAWMCPCTESYTSIEKAKKVVEYYRENNTVLAAWINEYHNDVMNIVYFKCYTDILGFVRK